MRRSRGMLVAILVVAALMAAPLSVAADTNTYTVVSGDTLSRIAARLGVASYMEIVELTNATHATDPSFAFIENPNLIRVGWKLAIPGAAPAEAPGPTQSALVATAQQTDVGVSQVSNLESLGILGLVMPSEAELARLPQSTVDLLTAQIPAMYSTMVDSLKNQSAFTMFIPSGSAWMRLSDAQLQTLASDVPLRTSTWLNHVVPSKVMAADLVDGQTLTTLGGQALTVTRTGDQVSINGRPLLRTDVQPPSGQIASRGIVHVVDGILSAEALGGQANDYVVVAGDTLFKIAAQLLGDGHRYPEIVALTNSAGPGYATIQNPNLIGVGWKLAIPAR